MKGQEISQAWQDWRDSAEGQKASNGVTSGVYLLNRLEVAFQAGIKAAEKICGDVHGRKLVAPEPEGRKQP